MSNSVANSVAATIPAHVRSFAEVAESLNVDLSQGLSSTEVVKRRA
jgi:hypothetical protein